jgi:penicillin-binding protein-related factor A (putative recombinase)
MDLLHTYLFNLSWKSDTMNHNDIIHNFSNKTPAGSFFFFFAKSKYKTNPFDCLFIYKGFTHAIEVKTEKDKLQKHQKYYLELIERNGGLSWVLRGAFAGKDNYYQLEKSNGLIIKVGNLNTIINFIISQGAIT